MSEREAILEKKGYALGYPEPKADAIVQPLSIVGNVVYVSGNVSIDLMGTDKWIGKVPSQVSADDAKKSAEVCAVNCLRALKQGLGSLDRIKRVLRLTGYVNADADFSDEHVVINGASELVYDVFGDVGKHARTALGVAQLPLGVATELEMIVEI